MKLRPTIEHEGQRYFDDAVYVEPKRVSILERQIAGIFKRRLEERIKVGYDRVRLNWMKPDGRGGLVHR